MTFLLTFHLASRPPTGDLFVAGNALDIREASKKKNAYEAS